MSALNHTKPLFSYIGREKELKILEPLLRKHTSSLIVFKGRRRVGKSRLAQEFAKNHRFLKFSGLAPTEGTTPEMQRQEFMKQLTYQTGLPKIHFDDWTDALSLLASQVKTGRVTVLLDEISWMAQGAPDFLPKLKNAWDLYFKENPELILILCGSISSWIDKNILQSTGFVGRISLVLSLEPLTLRDSSIFIKKIAPNLSKAEQFQILSITGGIPRYLEEILPQTPAAETIHRLCFTPEGLLFQEFNAIFSDLFSRRSPTYQRILMALIDGKKEFHSVCESLELAKSGSISEYLDDLIQAGFIKKDPPWDIPSQRKGRFAHYRISDNYTRFYLKFILPNQDKIQSGLFTNQSFSALPNWAGIMALQFENLVLQNRDLIWKAAGISPNDIAIENPFFQKSNSLKKGCQIDYLIQTQYNTLFPCEIKFSQNTPIGLSVITEMKEKLENLSLPKSFSYWPVLIHASEISPQVSAANYFSKIIDFSQFLT